MGKIKDIPVAQSETRERLERLQGYLAHDPHNPALLRDVADTAMAAGDFAAAAGALTVLEQSGQAGLADRNLHGLALMRGGYAAEAAARFAQLLAEQPGDPALRFNYAWATALTGDHAAARALLDDDLTFALPQAAQLEVQLLHQAGEFDLAAERARGHLARHPDYPPLLAAVSVLALDVDDDELALSCAQGGGAHPDALTTLGTLTLGDMELDRAQALFEQALAQNAQSPRAWIGLGLAHMARGQGAEAGPLLDKGAEMFGDHLGSWIAAGWAYLLAGDHATARARFDHAHDLDPTFAESHGSLAVMDVLAGDTDSARRNMEIAQRLDRESFAAVFTRLLLASAAGDTQTAQRIADMALNQPLDDKGRTIAAVLARMAR